MKNKYMYYCNRCGFNIELDTKEQYRKARKFHQKNGCVLVDTKGKSPVYTRPENLEYVQELIEKGLL